MAKTIKKAEGLSEELGFKPVKGADNEWIVIRPMPEQYHMKVRVLGKGPLLFHRYDVEEQERKKVAKKGSIEKTTDNIESYVYRDKKGNICMPGMNFKAALVNAAKRFQDPSSPRKSAHDLIRAGIVVDPYLAPILSGGKPTAEWHGVDVRGVVIQKNRIARSRPFMEPGWEIDFEVTVTDIEMVKPALLADIIFRAGAFSGLGDYRPDFGQFAIKECRLVKESAERAA